MLQRIAVRLARIALTLWFHLRLPLPCRVRSLLVNRRSSRVICLLADQLLVRKPLANNVAHGDIEAIRIRHLCGYCSGIPVHRDSGTGGRVQLRRMSLLVRVLQDSRNSPDRWCGRGHLRIAPHDSRLGSMNFFGNSNPREAILGWGFQCGGVAQVVRATVS